MKNRVLFFGFVILLLSGGLFCSVHEDANNNDHIKVIGIASDTIDSKKEPKRVLSASDITFDTIILEEGAKTTTRSFIVSRIDALLNSSLKKWTEDAGLTYPTECAVLRCFKKEHEFEVWAGNSENLQLVKTFEVCSFDDQPGTKLYEGDSKTPEGFYYSSFYYSSQYWFMWINLDPSEVDNSGSSGDGSGFRICIDYPNSADWARHKKYTKKPSPGSAICIHGNCVSAGCVSFENRVFLPVYAFASHHNEKKYGPLQVHIFPFRFTQENYDAFCDGNSYIDSESLVKIWKNLEEGCIKFENERTPLKFSCSAELYTFSN